MDFILNRGKNHKKGKEMLANFQNKDELQQLVNEAKQAMLKNSNKDKQNRILEIKELMAIIDRKFE